MSINRVSITVKIWLSIGIFVLGFVFSVALGQIQGREGERILRTASEAQFPAAQHSQMAEAAFHRVVKDSSAAVVMQDSSELSHAGEEGLKALAELKVVAGIEGLSAQRASEAKKLAAVVEQFLAEAQSTYEAVLANPIGITAQTQQRMKALAEKLEPAMKAVAPDVGITTTKTNEVPGLRPEDQSVAEHMALHAAQANSTHAVSYCTEAGLFQSIGIPSIICGPGNIEQAHKPDEYVEVAELQACEAYMLRLAKACL